MMKENDTTAFRSSTGPRFVRSPSPQERRSRLHAVLYCCNNPCHGKLPPMMPMGAGLAGILGY